MGSGGQVSTIKDLYRWNQALRNGPPAVREESLENYWSPPGGALAGGDMYGYEIVLHRGARHVHVRREQRQRLARAAAAERAPGARPRAARQMLILRPKFSLGIRLSVEEGRVLVHETVPGWCRRARRYSPPVTWLVAANGRPMADDPMGVLDPLLRKGDPIAFTVERDDAFVEVVVKPEASGSTASRTVYGPTTFTVRGSRSGPSALVGQPVDGRP